MIYYLDEDSAKNAQMLDDATLSRQIKAIAQCLCNVHHIISALPLSEFAKGNQNDHIPLSPYKFGNKYDKWAYECRANYLKMVEMGMACCREYEWRFTEYEWEDRIIDKENDFYEYSEIVGTNKLKEHKLQHVIEWSGKNVPDLDKYLLLTCPPQPPKETPFPVVMPEEYKRIKPMHPPLIAIESSYQNYYRVNLTKAIDNKVFRLTKEGKYTELNAKQFFPAWTRREKPKFLEY